MAVLEGRNIVLSQQTCEGCRFRREAKCHWGYKRHTQRCTAIYKIVQGDESCGFTINVTMSGSLLSLLSLAGGLQICRGSLHAKVPNFSTTTS
jgi:hypothetical protein